MAVFILQQDNGSVLSRGLEWTWEITPQAVFATPHRDIALNQLLELNIKDATLRARVVPCSLNERGLPVLPVVTKPQLSLIKGDESASAEDAQASVAS